MLFKCLWISFSSDLHPKASISINEAKDENENEHMQTKVLIKTTHQKVKQ